MLAQLHKKGEEDELELEVEASDDEEMAPEDDLTEEDSITPL